jgi:signal transduction histidine kinase
VNVSLNSNTQIILGEFRLLSTCFSIILDNAVKYSPINSSLDVTARDNDKFVSIEISDEGPGFSPTILSSLFELFSADNLEHHSHGFGIGLTTAKKIIDLLGGKITIRNKERGASVVLHFKKPSGSNSFLR